MELILHLGRPVDAKEQWQALQTKLNEARARADAGDVAGALEEIDAALAIDPESPAAQALRDRILAISKQIPESPPSSSAPTLQPTPQPASLPVPRKPLVSTEGYARFEQRAKRRRFDRRVEAARIAIARKKFREARAAIDEVRELEPDSPELISLIAALEEARRVRVALWRGPWLTAAAVFVAIVFGASWLEHPDVLLTGPPTLINALNSLRQLTPVVSTTMSDEVVPVGTTGTAPAAVKPEPISAPEIPPAQILESVPPDPLPAPPQSVSLARALPAPGPPPPPSNMSDTAVAAAIVDLPRGPAPELAPSPVVSRIDDETMVQQTLQRYRTAYDGLDAQSARDVWPAVNQAALARAFDGLESQNLTFDACNVELSGEAATAICRGTARYVPKVGSRAPRTEPRVWNFTLHKLGSDWKIESARANR